MARSKSHADDSRKAFVKESNTGHAQSPAKRAPMSAKKTKLLGAEQTSDGKAKEAKTLASRGKTATKRDFKRTKLEKIGTVAER